MRHLVEQFMREKGLTTQRALADCLNVSEASVNNWWRGKSRPLRGTLEKMAAQASGELSAAIRNEMGYEWHPTKSDDIPAVNPVSLLSRSERSIIADAAKRLKKKNLAEYYADLIKSGWEVSFRNLRETSGPKSPAAARVRNKAS